MTITETISQSLYNVVDWTPAMTMTPAVQAWHTQKANYRNWWDAASSASLQITAPQVTTKDGKPPLIYPLQINPVPWIISRHTGALFGEVPDQADSMVKISYLNKDRQEDDLCKTLTDIINTIWLESNGREIMLQNGSVNQFLGGSFFKLSWEPDNKFLTHKIKIKPLIPDFVLPIYDTSDYWTLHEAWIMYYITSEEAKANYGVDVAGPRVLYAEHWTKDWVETQIGGVVPAFKVGTADYTGSRKPNPWGFVPLVYIPHPPRMGTFYGQGHVDDIWGSVKELNRRMADYGDYIQQGSHLIPWGRNLSSKMVPRDIGNGVKVLDAGTKSMTAGGDPHLDTLDLPALGAGAHKVFVDLLLDLIDRSANLTPVAYGEDEGSQRSGVTLATRMWPLQVHIRNERIMWTTALRKIHQMALLMMLSEPYQKHPDRDPNVTKEMLKLRSQIGWYSMLPLDRQAQVDEASKLLPVGGKSPEAVAELLIDGGDVQEEVDRIYAWKKFQNDLAIELAKAKPAAPAGGF